MARTTRPSSAFWYGPADLTRRGAPCPKVSPSSHRRTRFRRSIPISSWSAPDKERLPNMARRVLAAGFDFMFVSSGALVDDTLRSKLIDTARRCGSRLLLPAGATAGLDGLSALRVGGLHSVRYTSTKPAGAWVGTPAERNFDLDRLTERTVIFAGSAREAARLYPKNANIAATIALAGLGLDDTEVRLVADPNASDNMGRLEAEGKFGTLRVEATGTPTPENPKTSANTAFSLLHAMRNRNATLVI